MIGEFAFIISDLRTGLRTEKCDVIFNCLGICFAVKTRRSCDSGN
jgi:hypothetical protein